MISFEEIKEALSEVREDHQKDILAYSLTVSGVIASFSVTLFKDIISILKYCSLIFIILFIILFLFLLLIILLYHLRYNYNPIKIEEKNCKIILESPDKLKDPKNKDIFIDTQQILVNNKTTTRYSFTIKIKERIKKELEGKRFTIILKKPKNTLELDPWPLKKRWDQKSGNSPDDQCLCLDQDFIGNTLSLKFTVKIKAKEVDSDSELVIYFDYGSKLNDIEKGTYKLPKKHIHVEPVHCTKVVVK